MEEKKTSNLANGLIWFGAAVSIAEIFTGTMLAPLGFEKGLLAILIGHVIGCILMCFSGVIGGKTGKSAMETVKMSFGQRGAVIFSALNILQLLGWTAIMIYNGADAAMSVLPVAGIPLWSLIIGAFIIIWLLVGIRNMSRLNIVAMGALFVLSVITSVLIFRGKMIVLEPQTLGFGAAVELSAIMPLSWLPLISDYTRVAKKPVSSSIIGSLTYFASSSWMYIIGLQAMLITGENGIHSVMLKAGMGIAALLIIVFSTVTTTYMDAYSAGVSFESISKKIKDKPASIVVCIIGTILSMFVPISYYENFLYLIGSVFAPMIAIMLVDYFLLKKDHSSRKFYLVNLLVWILGFVVYRFFLTVETPLGSTFPSMLITGGIAYFSHHLIRWIKSLGPKEVQPLLQIDTEDKDVS